MFPKLKLQTARKEENPSCNLLAQFYNHNITTISDISPVSRKEFLNIQPITECRFTLKAYVTDKKHSFMHSLLYFYHLPKVSFKLMTATLLISALGEICGGSVFLLIYCL